MNSIHPSAHLGENCQIGNFVTIGADCVLGNGVVIHNNVTLYPGTQIGDNTEIFEGAVIGRPPKTVGNMIHKVGKNFLPSKIGNGCVIGSNSTIYAQVTMGDHVLIGDGVRLRENAKIGDSVLIAMNCTVNHDVTIKNRSRVLDLSHITAYTIIEENVFVGVGITSCNDNAMRMEGSELGSSVHIHMERGCKVGSAVAILPGVTIGEDSFVGASALVTRDVPADTRVMGIPAKER